jgi:hypothetical protein
MTHAQSIGRPVTVSAIISVAILVFGVPLLLGMPGAIFAGIAGPAVEWLRGLPAGHLFRGDLVWPLAIAMTRAVPPGIPLVVWLGLVLSRGRRDLGALLIVAGLWLWSVVVLLGLTAGL